MAKARDLDPEAFTLWRERPEQEVAEGEAIAPTPAPRRRGVEDIYSELKD